MISEYLEGVRLSDDGEDLFSVIDIAARAAGRREGMHLRLQRMEEALIAALEVMSPAQRRRVLEARQQHLLEEGVARPLLAPSRTMLRTLETWESFRLCKEPAGREGWIYEVGDQDDLETARGRFRLSCVVFPEEVRGVTVVLGTSRCVVRVPPSQDEGS